MIQHDGLLIVLVAHAPNAMHGIVVAAQLRLAPKGGPKIVETSAALLLGTQVHTHTHTPTPTHTPAYTYTHMQ